MNARLPVGARVLVVLAIVGLVTALAHNKLESPWTGIDDANIFFVYARNVSAGEGFVFNPGSERVEGFTSLLWALTAAVATGVAGAPELMLLVVNVLLVTLTLVACLRGLTGTWATAFLVLVLFEPSYVVWHTITLMETALWGALLTAAVLICAEDRARRLDSGLLTAVTVFLVLTRPEALVWVPVLIALCYVNRASAGRDAALRFVAPAAVGFALSAALLTLFRLLYFGFPLPNTYYAKVSPSLVYSAAEGLKYLASFIKASPVVTFSVLALFASTLHLLNTRLLDRRTLALTVSAATGLAIPVLTGGDHFDGHRFYQPIYPLLVLTLLNFIRDVAPHYVPGPVILRMNRHVKLAATAVALGAAIVLQMVAWITTDRSVLLGREFDIATAGRHVGTQANFLFDGLHPLPDVATITVGGLKYAYKGDVVDLMGLNLTRMAHNGGNRMGVRSHAAFELDTFFELQPNIVLPLVQYHESPFAVGQRDAFANRVLKGLLDRPEFHARYQLAEVRKTTATGVVTIAAWYERAFLARLARAQTLQVVIADRDDR